MAISKTVKFNDYRVEITKIRLRDANILFPFVVSAMTKIGFGNFDFFADLTKDNIELIQQKVCEYSYKISEEKRQDGNIEISKRNISLSDLDECIPDIISLIMNFLEFNFGFFSRAPQILEDMIESKVSGSVE